MDEANMSASAQATRRANRQPGLNKYGSDLTAHAREGKLDPVIGREKEIPFFLMLIYFVLYFVINSCANTLSVLSV
jgi:ATP-dependent Clp protease ATP-binding subunit ClpA